MFFIEEFMSLAGSSCNEQAYRLPTQKMPGEESHANEGRRTTKAYDSRQLGLDSQCLAD